VIDSGNLALGDAEELEAFLRGLPFTLDPGVKRFVLGFPRHYLTSTPRVEIVKHFSLMSSLGERAVITSLAREQDRWKLCVVTRDRRFLFSRIAGALSSQGMNIVAAEAFANASALVLDTFHFTDDQRHFADEGQRRRFQAFLEDVVEGSIELEPLLQQPLADSTDGAAEALGVEMDDDSHPDATRLRIDCRDRFGLLYLVSRTISEAGHDIQLARIETPGRRVKDEFFLTHEGQRLTQAQQSGLASRLAEVTSGRAT
jgi:[protein-PII] uridylyltransferase